MWRISTGDTNCKDRSRSHRFELITGWKVSGVGVWILRKKSTNDRLDRCEHCKQWTWRIERDCLEGVIDRHIRWVTWGYPGWVHLNIQTFRALSTNELDDMTFEMPFERSKIWSPNGSTLLDDLSEWSLWMVNVPLTRLDKPNSNLVSSNRESSFEVHNDGPHKVRQTWEALDSGAFDLNWGEKRKRRKTICFDITICDSLDRIWSDSGQILVIVYESDSSSGYKLPYGVCWSSMET